MSLQVRLCQEAQGRQAAQVGTAPPRPPTSGPGRSKGGLSEGTRDGENKGGEKGRGGAVCTGQHQVRPRPYPCFVSNWILPWPFPSWESSSCQPVCICSTAVSLIFSKPKYRQVPQASQGPS